MLYDVSVAANSSQLGGQAIIAGTVIVEIQGTNYTGMCVVKEIKIIFSVLQVQSYHKSHHLYMDLDDIW